MTTGWASLQITPTREGRNLASLVAAKTSAALTTSYAGFVTPWVPAHMLDAMRFILDWEPGDATSIETVVEFSDASDPDTGTNPIRAEHVAGAPSSGVALVEPYVRQFTAAKYATFFDLGDEVLMGSLSGADMNSTADQEIALSAAPTRFVVSRIVASNPSVELDTAVGGVYPTTAKGGTAIVANTQVYSALVVPADTLELTVVDTTDQLVLSSVYLSLTTGQGAAATADLAVYGQAVLYRPEIVLDDVRSHGWVRLRAKKTGGSAASNLAVSVVGGA